MADGDEDVSTKAPSKVTPVEVCGGGGVESRAPPTITAPPPALTLEGDVSEAVAALNDAEDV